LVVDALKRKEKFVLLSSMRIELSERERQKRTDGQAPKLAT
jgi:hypothetical protein